MEETQQPIRDLTAPTIDVVNQSLVEISTTYPAAVARLESENNTLRGENQALRGENQALISEAQKQAAEIESLRAQLEYFKKQATVDELTGLSNQGACIKAIDEQWRIAGRENQTVGIVVVDLDHLKKLNEKYGHQGADKCLAAIGGAIKDTLQRPGDEAYRSGGDEFTIILPNTNASGSWQVAEKIRAAIGDLEVPTDMGTAKVTASLGVASMKPGAGKSSEEWVKAADDAAYHSKKDGRNQVSVAVTPGQMDMWRGAVQAGNDPIKIQDFNQLYQTFENPDEKFGLSPAKYEEMKREVKIHGAAQKMQEAQSRVGIPQRQSIGSPNLY